MPQMLWIVASILIVLALIAVVAWLVRRFAGNSLGASGNRGRMPRLAVIDAAAVDGRRRLVLVRRDNIEHLIMIGGPTDLVVEPNIMRGNAQPQRDPAPTRAPMGVELPPRIAPLPDAPMGWADNDPGHEEISDFPEPMPVPERAARQHHFEEPRRAPSIAERNRDEFGGLVPEPVTPRSERAIPRSERNEPSLPRMPRASDVQPRPSATPRSARTVEPPVASADQNLAEMAQRLEAALRRPGERPDSGAGRGGVAIDPMDRVGAPPVAPEPPIRAAREPANASRNAPAAPKPAFDNLEDEMASLLGRPKNST
ncbi:MAG: flagellar biosynthesis protein FliO [Bradyrhizobiaceae bacterium]|nr:MAG: flagellar biosynthesis protein FliO [Bradyrhizobiaceae bacterium]